MTSGSVINVVFSLLTAFVAGQSGSLDPSTLSLSVRTQWCSNQMSICPLLCTVGGKTDTNTCDASTLQYDCTCANGTAPGLEYYMGTIPTFICQQVYTSCLLKAMGDATGQKKCAEARDANCGKLDASKLTYSGAKSDASISTSASENVGPVSSSSVIGISKPIPTPEPLSSSSASSTPTSVPSSTSSSNALVEINSPSTTSNILSTTPSSPGIVSTSGQTTSSSVKGTTSGSVADVTVTNTVATTVLSTIPSASALASASQSAAERSLSKNGVILSACMLIGLSGTVLAW